MVIILSVCPSRLSFSQISCLLCNFLSMNRFQNNLAQMFSTSRRVAFNCHVYRSRSRSQDTIMLSQISCLLWVFFNISRWHVAFNSHVYRSKVKATGYNSVATNFVSPLQLSERISNLIGTNVKHNKPTCHVHIHVHRSKVKVIGYNSVVTNFMSALLLIFFFFICEWISN